jgi:hypothetical protein
VQTPDHVVILTEMVHDARIIRLGAYSHPPAHVARWLGDSIGRWEGDTLVAETVGFNGFVQHARGVPHGDKMKIVERFRLTDPDTMSIETTVTDPDALTTPYTTTASLRRHRNWTISEYVCEENNRNSVDTSGKAGIDSTLPGTNKK